MIPNIALRWGWGGAERESSISFSPAQQLVGSNLKLPYKEVGQWPVKLSIACSDWPLRRKECFLRLSKKCLIPIMICHSNAGGTG